MVLISASSLNLCLLLVATIWVVFANPEKITLDTWMLIDPVTSKVIGEAGPSDPKDVYLIHYKSGLIPNPLVGYGDRNLRSMSNQSWVFRSNFTLKEHIVQKYERKLEKVDPKLILTLHGIDTISTILMNGNQIGQTANMFHSYEFQIDRSLLRSEPGAAQLLEIIISSPTQYSLAQAAKYKTQFGYDVPPDCPVPEYHGECYYNFIRKMAASYAWDWGPSFPGAAIWQPVELDSWVGCRFGNLTVLPMAKGSELFSSANWQLIVEFDAQCDSDAATNVQVIATIEKLAGIAFNKSVTVGKTQRAFKFIWELPSLAANLSLWWPNSMGQQSLYTLRTELKIGEASEADGTKLTKRFGFRTVDLIQSPVKASNGSDAGLTFYFRINRIPVFLKGSNWIPNTIFPANASCERYEVHFQTMVLSHFTAIRVWGGGHYELDCFYDLADRHGILLWQDFMFACALYPTDPDFLSEVSTEANFQIKRLKSHPSIFIWAGNNENEAFLATGAFHLDANYSVYKKDYLQLYNATLLPIATMNDPSRPFLLSSPSDGQETDREGGIAKNPYSEYYGDVHYYNYDSDGWSVIGLTIPRCASEYGFQSFPSVATMLEELSLSELSYFGEAIDHRQHHPEGQSQIYNEIGVNLVLPKNCSNENPIKNSKGGPGPASLCDINFYIDMTYLSQINQAMSVRTQSEHYRRMMGNYLPDGRGNTMCAMFWQLNDIWSAPTWAGVDHGGRWKMLQYYAKNFFAPLLPSIYFAEDGNVYGYVVSDLLYPVKEVEFRVTVLAWGEFRPIFISSVNIPTVSPLKSRLVYKSKDQSSDLKSLRKKVIKSQSGIIFKAQLFQNGSSASAESIVYIDKILNVDPTHFGTARVVSVIKMPDKPGYQLVLSADKPVPFLWIICRAVDGLFSDNGFTMTVDRVDLEFVPSSAYSGDLAVNDFEINSLRKSL